ncbi:MAG: hypothetical protein OSJ65_07530 [Bacilli bacterium]|nr:hypothetical protein [Bacilli bacterium]
MKIEKVISESMGTYDYIFTNNNLKLQIFFGGNLDLYWQIIDKTVNADNMYDYENKPLEFIIDEENMEVYLLFLKLYNDILNKKMEKGEDSPLDELLPPETKSNLKKNYDKELEDAYALLVQDGVISWHSDETYYEAANIVNIELLGGNLKITFIKQVEYDVYSFPGEISIRFRNSGSTYQPLNRHFMEHFNALANISIEKHENKKEFQEKKLTSQPKVVD